MGPRIKKQTVGQGASPPASQSLQPGSEPPGTTTLPLELQQGILDMFWCALPPTDLADLKVTTQQIKGHLYDRDFTRAFGRENFRLAYALRWSAGRAIAYAEILTCLSAKCSWLKHQTPVKVACIGGGAGAELIALAAAVARHRPVSTSIIDIADWRSLLEHLWQYTMNPPPLSQYASAAAKAAHAPFLRSGQMDMQFHLKDVLEAGDEIPALFADRHLVTLMFTLNELFTSSVSKTAAFLLALTDAMQANSWLLVVDSPGSYSEVALGQHTQPKRYPMKWLLDHTLLQVAGTLATGEPKWRKALGDDAKWFRVDPSLRYPIELENMRYQVHLFQRS